MNSNEYIESGVLELYVSGLLSIEEMRDVELKACQFPEVKSELDALQLAMEHFAMIHSLNPRPELKNKIMSALQSHEPTDVNQSLSGKGKIRKMEGNRSYTGLLAAASIALLAIVSALTIYFASQYSEEKKRVARLEQQQLDALKEMQQMQLSMTKTADNLKMLSDPGTVRVMMKGTSSHEESVAIIYWNKQTKDVYLDIRNLPPAPSDKQYQLWFIDSSNKPVSAGVFDLRTGEFLKMNNASEAIAFAVTLEPRGGSVNPTLDQMYVIGNVIAS